MNFYTSKGATLKSNLKSNHHGIKEKQTSIHIHLYALHMRTPFMRVIDLILGKYLVLF